MKEILHVALEYKRGVGGLRAVTNGLLPSLANRNKDNIYIVTPYYSFFRTSDLKDAVYITSIKHIHQGEIFTSDVYLCKDLTKNGVVNHYLIKPENNSPVARIFDIDDEKNVYQAYEHSEPLYRLSYFNGAVASLVRLSHADKVPEFDIVHTHTWHTSLAACLIKEYEWLSLTEKIRSTISNMSPKKIPYIVNTIHMLSEAEHGLLTGNELQLLLRLVGLPKKFELKFKGFSKHIAPNATKQIVLGLLYCDQVTIVSKNLVENVLNGKGCGIDDIFKKLKAEDRLLGIDNGISFETWDATSRLGESSIKLDQPLQGKKKLKDELCKKFANLDPNKKWFLYVGRFSEEKGTDMFEFISDAIREIGANFIIMGVYSVENSSTANHIKSLIDSYKDKPNILVIDDNLTQQAFGLQIRAASDFTIVPSHVEAFGLVPREAMACGSIPITSNAQGLADSVQRLDENNATGTGFIYNDDISTRKDNVKKAIFLADKLYNKLLEGNQINSLLTRILTVSKSFDWNQSAADSYISMYEKVLMKPLLLPEYEQVQSSTMPKMSPELVEFLDKCEFDSTNLNKVNGNGVTPLTVAIEKNMFGIAEELLNLGANPILANCHGNTPLLLLTKKPNNQLFMDKLSRTIESYTIPELTEEANQIIEIKRSLYKVDRIIKSGSCSLSLLEITCLSSKKRFVLKINSQFGGIELRNNILFDMFNDLLNIKAFIKSDGETKENVQVILQPLIPGTNLNDLFMQHSDDQEEIDRVIALAIVALNKLHVNMKCVHRDALPGNAIYDSSEKTVIFIDFESLRKRSDPEVKDFELEKHKDFARLLLGDGNECKGLSHFTKNMRQIIAKISNSHIHSICDVILNPLDIKPQITHKRDHPIRVLHVALEYGQAVLGGLGIITTQMVEAQNALKSGSSKRSVAAIITPFYPKLYTESKFTKVTTIKHLFGGKLVTSNILFSEQNKHYAVEPASGPNLFDIDTIHGIYNDVGVTLINKLLYFNSAVAAYISQGETLDYHHPKPQIIQLHDWTVALVPMLLSEVYSYNQVKSMFVVHMDNFDNGAYTHDTLMGIGIEFEPGTYMLKAIGVKNSDMIVTVSPTFLHECLNSIGQDNNVEVMRKLFVIANAKKRLRAIANGFSYEKYCPLGVLIRDKSNIFLEKLRVKTELARHLNGSRTSWKIDPNLPLILYVGRYSPEKGVETFKQLIDAINRRAVFMAFGRGFDQSVLDVINTCSRRMNNIYVTFSELEQEEYLPLARAGAEFTFIPSHREANGLVTKEGFASGCISITSGVSGLKDSVVKFDATDPDNTSGNSFIYEDCNDDSLKENINQALLIWSNFKPAQKSITHLRLMDEARKHDWVASDGPLKEYNEAYEDMIVNKRPSLIS